LSVERGGNDEFAELRARVADLAKQNEHLRIGLASRIIIEQAKGILIERLDLPPEEIFELLRAAARRSRTNIHTLADEILQSRVTPGYIMREIEHLVPGDSSSGWKRKT
jgi:AmiR/NasT family two-component response regulator